MTAALIAGWPALAATGHYRNGILLAPWTARQIAGMALAGAAESGEDAETAAFAPGRFGDGH